MTLAILDKPIGFIRARLVAPLLSLLRQGVSADKLALAVAMGFTLGCFPMLGSTTLLCLIFGWIFRLNPAAIQLVNYFTYPLQLILFIPFFSMGALMFGADVIPFSLEDIVSRLAENPWDTISLLWLANLRAIAAWTAVAVPVTIILHRLLRSVFTQMTPVRDTMGKQADTHS